MKTDEKGYVAILKVEQRAIEKGYIVSRPVTPARYDLILDTGLERLRVQVKYANGKSTNSSGAVTLSMTKWSRSGSLVGGYRSDEVDGIAVYLPVIEAVCWFTPNDFVGKEKVVIRYSPAKNGQKSGVWMAEEYLW